MQVAQYGELSLSKERTFQYFLGGYITFTLENSLNTTNIHSGVDLVASVSTLLVMLCDLPQRQYRWTNEDRALLKRRHRWVLTRRLVSATPASCCFRRAACPHRIYRNYNKLC